MNARIFVIPKSLQIIISYHGAEKERNYQSSNQRYYSYSLRRSHDVGTEQLYVTFTNT